MGHVAQWRVTRGIRRWDRGWAQGILTWRPSSPPWCCWSKRSSDCIGVSFASKCMLTDVLMACLSCWKRFMSSCRSFIFESNPQKWLAPAVGRACSASLAPATLRRERGEARRGQRCDANRPRKREPAGTFWARLAQSSAQRRQRGRQWRCRGEEASLERVCMLLSPARGRRRKRRGGERKERRQLAKPSRRW